METSWTEKAWDLGVVVCAILIICFITDLGGLRTFTQEEVKKERVRMEQIGRAIPTMMEDLARMETVSYDRSQQLATEAAKEAEATKAAEAAKAEAKAGLWYKPWTWSKPMSWNPIKWF
jgi:hypothetical protein